ncbi:hypothetical protein SAMN05216285_2481 [Natrinema salifodinae]|uniref:Uncharacterized protein n=1 Tax=Natrinema salifodinae TaxID=1202768 RepID=A0A1I0PEA1_9EURY|nr:hypothetical protein SAMN05216285_2481 [Natrinema salifodinae]
MGAQSEDSHSPFDGCSPIPERWEPVTASTTTRSDREPESPIDGNEQDRAGPSGADRTRGPRCSGEHVDLVARVAQRCEEGVDVVGTAHLEFDLDLGVAHLDLA